jgi:hypothetical protein
MTDPVAKIEEVLGELELELGSGHQRQVQLMTKLRVRLEPFLDKSRPPALNRPAVEWVTALLEQASLDLRAAEVLDLNVQGPTVAMLLQMAFEKIAKAYLARTNWPAFASLRRSHAVAKRLTQALKRGGRQFLPRVGPQSRKVLPWIEALTEAHPALRKNGPHLEYPWEASDRVQVPVELSIVKILQDPGSGAAVHLIKFAHYFIDNFDNIVD